MAFVPVDGTGAPWISKYYVSQSYPWQNVPGQDLQRHYHVVALSMGWLFGGISPGYEPNVLLIRYFNSFPPKARPRVYAYIHGTTFYPTHAAQSLSISGTPTGGTFTLTRAGQTTVAIAFNATAATVQTALNNLTLLGQRGGVTCTGGPLPGTAITINFVGIQDEVAFSHTDSLTGGTTPAVSVSINSVGGSDNQMIPDVYTFSQLGGVSYYAIPEWFLCYGGTTLIGTVSATATTIQVLAAQNLYNAGTLLNHYIMVGGRHLGQPQAEIMKITGEPATKTGVQNFTVARNQFPQSGHFAAQSFSIGNYVRCLSVGESSAEEAFQFDPRSNAPTTGLTDNFATAMNYSTAIAKVIQAAIANDSAWGGGATPTGAKPDGVYLDNVPAGIQAQLGANYTLLDINNTNAKTGLTQAQYEAGMQNLFTQLKTFNSGLGVAANTGGFPASGMTSNNYLNGGATENLIATASGTHTTIFTGDTGGNGVIVSEPLGTLAATRSWLSGWTGDALFIAASAYDVNAAGQATAYQQHRYCLALCCMYKGYLNWDTWWATPQSNHGDLIWFDEYDLTPHGNGQRGWLGQPLAALQEPNPNCLVRYFENGAVLFNGTGSPYTFTLSGQYRRIQGTQDPVTNNGQWVGSTVTVPAYDGLFLQRAQHRARPTIGNYKSYIKGEVPTWYWPLDDAVGTTTFANQGSGPANTLTAQNSVTLGSAGPPLVEGGTCALLAASTAYFSSSYVLSDPTSFTWEALIKTTTSQGNIFGWERPATGARAGGNIWLSIVSNNLSISCTDSSNTLISAASATSVIDGVWHMIHGQVEADGGKLRIYLDGVPANEVAFGNGGFDLGLPFWPMPNVFLKIGGSSAMTTNFNGSLAHVAVYSRVLNAADVRDHYKAFTSVTRSVRL